MMSDTRQFLGIIGAILIIIGIFVPIMHVPIVGNIIFWDYEYHVGKILLIITAIALIMILLRQLQWLWFFGLTNLIIIIGSLIYCNYKMDQGKAELASDLAENPFRGLADIALESIEYQWGWGLLMAGAILMIACSFIGRQKYDEQINIHSIKQAREPLSQGKKINKNLTDGLYAIIILITGSVLTYFDLYKDGNKGFISLIPPSITCIGLSWLIFTILEHIAHSRDK